MKSFKSKFLILPVAIASAMAVVPVSADDMVNRDDRTQPHDSAGKTYQVNNIKQNEVYADKKSSDAYWAEFKQDSKQSWKDTKSAFRDGWVEGKLETALIMSKELNPFEIDIRVDGSDAVLEGQVDSEIDKELAENIALGIEGIDSVSNKLTVSGKVSDATNREKKLDDNKRDFSQYMADVSKTAAIKTELLTSSNVSGMAIDVDTYNDKVTLTGEVKTQAQKELAESIVSKRDDVTKVINKLQVKS